MFETITSLSNLDEFIWNSNQQRKNIMLIFSASWCGPCTSLKDYLKRENYEDKTNTRIAYIDIDSNDEIAAKYKIKSLPTQVFVSVSLENNKAVVNETRRIVGFNPSLL